MKCNPEHETLFGHIYVFNKRTRFAVNFRVYQTLTPMVGHALAIEKLSSSWGIKVHSYTL